MYESPVPFPASSVSPVQPPRHTSHAARASRSQICCAWSTLPTAWGRCAKASKSLAARQSCTPGDEPSGCVWRCGDVKEGVGRGRKGGCRPGRVLEKSSQVPALRGVKRCAWVVQIRDARAMKGGKWGQTVAPDVCGSICTTTRSNPQTIVVVPMGRTVTLASGDVLIPLLPPDG
eukprot:274205-Chlamydomonas_euryale.AAC.4